jgi:phosphatidylglycerol---prolipoprotein diacylglyceryl transferase
MDPLIPYIQLPDLVLIPERVISRAPLALKPFGTLVALGVYVGSACAIRHARRVGLDARTMVSFLTWIVLSSFFFGHVFDALSYYPEEVARDPWMLLRLWEGLSSFGGFAGAIIGGLAWRFRHRTRVLEYTDAVAACFPVSWTFGRLGCAVVHDHPGIRSDAWFAVKYPGGARIDLGLLELAITVPLMIAFFVLMRRRRPWGFFAGVMCTYYAPLRFALDFLRETEGVVLGPLGGSGDARYFALTPAQWGCIPLFLLGLELLRRSRDAGTTPPPVPLAFRVASAAPAEPPAASSISGVSRAEEHGAARNGRDQG